MIYLDYAATAPMSPLAQEAYLGATSVVGNAASVHQAGQQAREVLEEGRSAAAQALGVHPLTLIATGGGSEGNNQVLMGLDMIGAVVGQHLITTATEHSSVLAPAQRLEKRGVQVTYLTPDQNGLIDPQVLARAMRPETRLVSIHAVNNELGTVQDIAALCEVAHQHGSLFHTDSVQAPGVMPVDLTGWGVDFATFSAHKWGGGLGVGLLYMRRGQEWPALILGGGQEKGLRAGTQNTPGLYAAGLSLLDATQHQPATHAYLRSLNDQFTALVTQESSIRQNHTATGSPKVASFTVEGADGEGLLMNLDMAGICASAGSACSAGTMQPSHVLLAIGMDAQSARATVRFSFGTATTMQEVEQAARAFVRSARASRL